MSVTKKINLMLAGTALGLTLSMSTSAQNLIVNGSFETPDITTVIGKKGSTSSTWQYYDSSDVDGFSGSNIEIWEDGFLGVNAVDGEQFIELNSHPTSTGAFSIEQMFDTVAGQYYDLSFSYEARSNNDEAFNVSVVGGVNVLLSEDLDDHEVGGAWSFFTGMFKAESEHTTLTFTAITPTTHTYGNFIDDVRVTQSVPEMDAGSGALAIGLVLGIMGLFREKKRAK